MAVIEVTIESMLWRCPECNGRGPRGSILHRPDPAVFPSRDQCSETLVAEPVKPVVVFTRG